MVPSLPQHMTAVKVRGPNDVYLDDHAALPSPGPDYVLIKVLSVALNPTDYKGVAFFQVGGEPRTIGCDVAGRVVRCGERCAHRYREGDRVAGLCYGNRPGEPTQGAFGEYALIKEALSLRVPDHVGDAEAATIPVGTNFAGQALYHTLKLPLPSITPREPASTGPTILIYGGATATGMFALQFARLSGCRVLTTCSPHNFGLVKALGAHEAFDYHDAVVCAASIRTATNNDLRYVFDCISDDSSLQICAESLTPAPDVAVYTGALPVAGRFPRSDVRHGWTSGYTAFGEEYFLLGNAQPVKEEDLAFATDFWQLAAELLKHDRIRLAPLVQRRSGGLVGIPDGLEELKGGQVAAGKLVYLLEEGGKSFRNGTI